MVSKLTNTLYFKDGKQIKEYVGILNWRVTSNSKDNFK